MTSLCLADQRIRDSGAIAIYRSLAPSNVRTLNFKGNELTDHSCLVLGEILAQNPKLEKIDLSRNEIGDEGACAVAAGITRNSKLQALNLAYNQIDDAGLDALTKVGARLAKNIVVLFLIFPCFRVAAEYGVEFRVEDAAHNLQ